MPANTDDLPTDIERLKRAMKQDIDIVGEFEQGVYLINGHRDINYLVNMNKFSCTCPDWRKERVPGGCKHILKVRMHGGDAPRISIQSRSEGASRGSDSTNSSYPSDWNTRREKVLKRDKHTCQSCGTNVNQEETNAEVHHSTYIEKDGSHELENLITLCEDCHNRLHSSPVETSQVTTTDSTTTTLSTTASSSSHTLQSQDSDSPPVNSSSSPKTSTPNKSDSDHQQHGPGDSKTNSRSNQAYNSKISSTTPKNNRYTSKDGQDPGLLGTLFGGLILSLVFWGILEIILMILTSTPVWSPMRYVIILGLVGIITIIGHIDGRT